MIDQIEVLIASLLNSVNSNNFPVKLPENTKRPALTYEVINKRKIKHVTKSNHYVVDFQINVFGATYQSAKEQQQKIYELFDENIYYEELDNVDYSIQTYVTNVVDLFSFNTNQIAITIQVEYIAHPKS